MRKTLPSSPSLWRPSMCRMDRSSGPMHDITTLFINVPMDKGGGVYKEKAVSWQHPTRGRMKKNGYLHPTRKKWKQRKRREQWDILAANHGGGQKCIDYLTHHWASWCCLGMELLTSHDIGSCMPAMQVGKRYWAKTQVKSLAVEKKQRLQNAWQNWRQVCI